MEDTPQPQKGLLEQAAEQEEQSAPEATPPQEIKVRPEELGIDLFDHNPEANAVKQDREKDGVAPLDELPNPDTKIQHPASLKDPVGNMKRIIDPFKDEFDIGTVEVTATERDAFVRSALNDTEMIFDIHLEGIDVNVKVAIPTEAFTTLAAGILDKWDALGAINAKSNVSWLLAFQQLHAWYQIRSFNGQETPWAKFFDDGVPNISKIREHIDNYDNLSPIVNMSGPRWRMMVNAMALAEYKYKLCLDAWRTRSFFEKAGTD